MSEIEKYQFDNRTAEEQRKIASAGGKASGEARRNKRDLREALELLLDKDYTDKKGVTRSGTESLATAIFSKALKGNTKAWELVRDTLGQKPADKVIMADVDPDVLAEVERMVNEDD